MFKRIIIFVILFLIFSYNAYAKEDCKLLVQFDNDLWIVDRDGRPISRLTYDGVVKDAATWSPDGQYIAYNTRTLIGEEKAIIIVDNTGREVSKIIVDPKGSNERIRFIGRIVWEKPTILWSDSNVGPHGGFIDIWQLDLPLRRPVKHEKRIKVFNVDCEISPNNRHMACITSIGDRMSLEISDTNKKEYPDAIYYYDRDPRTVDLKQIERVDKIRFTPDSSAVIIIAGERKLKFNMRDNKLSEIKELPQGVKIKRLPEAVKIKKDTDLYQSEVFDMYCN